MTNRSDTCLPGRTPALPVRHLSQVDEFLRRSRLAGAPVITLTRLDRPAFTAVARTRPAAVDPLTALATAVGVLTEAVS